jgi:hypothetical protein
MMDEGVNPVPASSRTAMQGGEWLSPCFDRVQIPSFRYYVL